MGNLREFVAKPFQSEFYQNILRLFSGLFMARIFPSLFALIIVRIYSPEDFGLFVLFLTIASALSIPATGKYENAIILADNEEQRKHAFSLSRKINLRVNAFILILLISYLMVRRTDKTSDIILFLLVPVFAYFFAGVQLVRHVLISQKDFRRLSFLEVWRALATGILQCLLFIFPQTGLFIGATIAQAAIYFVYGFRLKDIHRPFSIHIVPEERLVGQRYINFPKYSVGSELLNFLSSQLPVLLLKPFFGANALGLYSLPHRYISGPVQLFSNSISRVYVQEAQTLKNSDEQLATLSFSLFRKQLWLAIIPFTILALWGEGIFDFLFGAEWAYAGKLAQYISPWLFAVTISSPLSSIMVVREKQQQSLLFNFVLIFFRIASLAFGFFILKNLLWAIALYSFTGFVSFMFLGVYSLHLANVQPGRVVFFSLKIILLVLLPLILLKLWI